MSKSRTLHTKSESTDFPSSAKSQKRRKKRITSSSLYTAHMDNNTTPSVHSPHQKHRPSTGLNPTHPKYTLLKISQRYNKSPNSSNSQSANKTLIRSLCSVRASTSGPASALRLQNQGFNVHEFSSPNVHTNLGRNCNTQTPKSTLGKTSLDLRKGFQGHDQMFSFQNQTIADSLEGVDIWRPHTYVRKFFLYVGILSFFL